MSGEAEGEGVGDDHEEGGILRMML